VPCDKKETMIACGFFGPTRANNRFPFERQGQQLVETQGQGLVQVLGSAIRVLVLVLVLAVAVLAAAYHGQSGSR
jgi:hypothetical protein